MLPKPQCQFTLPSLHDDLELHARLYFPQRTSESSGKFVKGFAIFAHPYAPLGGSWDDPIVNTIGSILLHRGHILSTFNFRGAAGSHGKTSWTGKAEVGDYMSVYVFMVHLMNVSGMMHYVTYQGDLPQPRLILGGYSYGSMIASSLPNTDVVLQYTTSTKPNSSEHEIQLRAVELYKVFSGYADTRTPRGRTSPHSTDLTNSNQLPISSTWGGYQSESAGRRISRESSRHSLERMRQGIDKVRHRLGSKSNGSQQSSEDEGLSNLPECIIKPAVAFLLISPILPPISGLLTIFSQPCFEAKHSTDTSSQQSLGTSPIALSHYPSCAIYGGKDIFSPAKKLAKWAQRLVSAAGSMFIAYEVSDAGHFWREEGVDLELRRIVHEWLDAIASDAA